VWAVVVLTLPMLVAGGAAMVAMQFYFELSDSLPRIESMRDYRPSLTSRVLSADGKVLGRFFIHDRERARLFEIPRHLRDAVVAVEDVAFYRHGGIDFKGIFRAAVENLKAGRVVQGGSTITQQLARDLYLSREQKLIRKIKEALLAVNIERRFTKEQILELYLNQTYFGHGAYGVKAAARRFFGKSLGELTLAECALLAGTPKAPSRISPFNDPEAALARRRVVLTRMLETGFISRDEFEAAVAEPLHLAPPGGEPRIAAYFVEFIRQYLEERYGTELVHEGGLTILTSLDTRDQEAAERAVRKGLLALKRRQGYVRKEGLTATELDPARLAVGDVLVTPVTANGRKWFEVEVAGVTVRIEPRAEGWRLPGAVPEVFPVGENVEVQVLDLEREGGEVRALSLQLFQEPEVEGALLAMEPDSGSILAWVGGYDFARSQFNRVIQAIRQPGSCFKPIIYATALDTRFAPNDIIYDAPVIKEKAQPVRRRGEGEDEEDEEEDKYWTPMNYDRKFYGATTLRIGLEKSRNVVTVRLLQEIGVARVRRYARLMGIKQKLEGNLALALGSSGVTLYELLGVYSVFANRGEHVEPSGVIAVLDRDGNLLEEHIPLRRQALHPGVACQMSSILQGVVQRGTGVKAKVLERPLAGKTGTTQKYWDAWFIGYSPQVLAGVWVGFDQVKTLGRGETGSKAAVPIWIDFMRAAHEGLPVEEFPACDDLTAVLIDRETGLLATPQCKSVIEEYFLPGTEPTKFCDRHAGGGEEPPPIFVDEGDWDSLP
jgi:penicillin-binding protein 1A